MIRSLQNHTQPVTVQQTAHTGKTSPEDFRKLLEGSATPTNVAATPESNEPARLGPFTAGPTVPTPVAPKAPDPITVSPWLPPGTPGDQNLMNRAEHEATMNAWLKNYTNWSNAQKTQIYQQAMVNWQLNNQRCQELGLPAPPQPTPPTLDPVEDKPAGWWFQS
jgi:hypothetical protein